MRYIGEYTHMIMEAKKFHNRLSASCRTGKAGSMAQSKFPGTRKRMQ
jgi:hypothetical protein